MNGLLGCFLSLPVAHNAAMNTEVLISFWIRVFDSFENCPEVKLIDHMAVLLLTF